MLQNISFADLVDKIRAFCHQKQVLSKVIHRQNRASANPIIHSFFAFLMFLFTLSFLTERTPLLAKRAR